MKSITYGKYQEVDEQIEAYLDFWGPCYISEMVIDLRFVAMPFRVWGLNRYELFLLRLEALERLGRVARVADIVKGERWKVTTETTI